MALAYSPDQEKQTSFWLNARPAAVKSTKAPPTLRWLANKSLWSFTAICVARIASIHSRFATSLQNALVKGERWMSNAAPRSSPKHINLTSLYILPASHRGIANYTACSHQLERVDRSRYGTFSHIHEIKGHLNTRVIYMDMRWSGNSGKEGRLGINQHVNCLSFWNYFRLCSQKRGDLRELIICWYTK